MYFENTFLKIAYQCSVSANDHNIELIIFYHNDDINDSNGTTDPFAP